MRTLKDKILKYGQAIGTDIVKVDSFLNHQIDVSLISDIGKEFSERFSDAGGIDKILTIEASGIVVACAAAWHMNCIPVVFAKKTAPNTMTDGFYSAEVVSFTKRTVSSVTVSKKYLSKGENVLIIDDFLAYGEAALGLASIVKQSGARLCGIGAVIEKEFQGGSKKLRQMGYRVESLAVIESIKDGHIKFKDDGQY